MKRTNYPDVIYRSEREKYDAIADEIEQLNRWDSRRTDDGELIVGTIAKETDDAIDDSCRRNRSSANDPDEQDQATSSAAADPCWSAPFRSKRANGFRSLLDKRGIKHQVLNAKHHKREAEIVAQAGRKAAVTIATNMAGRGTDIILGGNRRDDGLGPAARQIRHAARCAAGRMAPARHRDRTAREHEGRGQEVKDLGGLHIIGTERHEARRIDLQLRGRCGRQGDPGSSRFYLSLEDDLMRIFAI